MMIIFYIFIVSFSLNASIDLTDVKKGLAKKIQDDELFFDLFQLKIETTLMKVDQNMNHLRKIEKDLDHSINSGRRDEEGCIRKGLSQLRTINYVYPWLRDQLNRIKGEHIRYVMFDILNRSDFLNKTFIDTSIKIDQCVLNIVEDQRTDRELVKDIIDAKINVLDKDLVIKDYEGAKVPFR